ncbi:cytochrome c oxidase assembly factor Coa1 family protein [Hyalangium sp.]|uniref:cytochrome c oxidase assembly factor Coa1 family protein n=1 Tax=Hyalangium sp. TaxID=2028555 RepID=UPI002D2832DB|nr:cytochrome c oxidase assembly factor Coa1 family protein [Hyalangium sp.]HYI03166.1 cytochrome c oxidase assembly factor Coa1 family protein [Hyalangium sp.]
METTPEGGMAPRRSWWSRNWKWAVPVGCLGLLASCGCLGAIAVYAGFNAVKNNEAYVQALAIAMSDDEVQATLGTPINTSLWNQQSSVANKDNEITAKFSVPLDGSKADGILRGDAIKIGNTWSYRVFQVEVPGQEPIDLRDKVGGGPPPGRQPMPSTPDEPPPAAPDEDAPAEDGEDEGQGEQDVNL